VLVLALLAMAHLVLAQPAFAPPPGYPATFATDLVRIRELSDAPGRPWRDHEVEYPPLLVVQAELVATDDFDDTGRRLALSQLLLHAAVVAALVWGWGTRGGIAYLGLALPFVAYPFVFQRTDFLAVALAVGGAAAWRRRRDGVAGALLALAFFAKAWPLVLGGALVATSRRRGAAIWAGVLIAGMLGWLLVGGLDAPAQVLTFRGATGAQIESLAGNVIGLVSDEAWREEAGAVRVGEVPAAVRLLLPALGLGIAGVSWALVWRRVRAGVPSLAFGAGALAAVAGLLCTSLLLSTQFTLWLLPWAAVIAAELPRRDHWGVPARRLEVVAVALAALIAAAAGPLMWSHPDVAHGDPGLWLLTARNVALVALLAICLCRLWLLDDAEGGEDLRGQS
jgi:hypothetical protein